MQEFINLCQGGMSMKEYSLRFTQLSTFAPTLVADSRAKMNNFFIGVSHLVVNECHSAMLIPSMNISRLMVHAEQIEKQKLKQGNTEVKRARTDDRDFSNARSDGYGQPRTQQKPSNQERVSKPNPLKGSNSESVLLKPSCSKYGRNHYGECLARKEGCYGCGDEGHKKRDCTILRAKGREAKQNSLRTLDPNTKHKS